VTYLNKVAADTLPEGVQNAVIIVRTVGVFVADDPGAIPTFTKVGVRRYVA
jgi:hypothetical protein